MNGSTILFLGGIFLGVVLLVEGAWYYYQDVHAPRTRMNRRLDQLRSGTLQQQIEASLKLGGTERSETFIGEILGKLESKLNQAGMRISPERFLSIMALMTLSIAIATPIFLGFANMLGSLTVWIMIAVLALGLGVMVPLAFLDRKAMKRIKKIEEQFPVALDIFVRGLRAGHPVTGALDLLVEEMPDPVGSEFATVVAEISYGYDLRAALENMADRIQTTDLRMFAVCVAIQSETGGNLAEILEGLANVIRERNSMVLKVRALASEGKMTAVVLSLLPLGTFAFVLTTNPSFYLNVMNDPIFLPGMIGIVVWYGIGMTIIRKLIDLKV
jgi:tight adherence protein B